MSRLLPVLPSPYDLSKVNRDRTVAVPQGDTAEFLFIATSLDGDTIDIPDKLKIALADGTQEGVVIWLGSWVNTVAETTSETPNVHRVVIPASITKTLREGAYEISVYAEFTVSNFVRNETLAIGTLLVTASAASPVRRHQFTGWTQVADFTQTFEQSQAVTPGVTEVTVVIPVGCVLQDVNTIYLSGFDPAMLFDIVVGIDGIVVHFEDEAAGTAPTIHYTVVKTNVDETSPAVS